jgi:hypothetical protein
MASPAKQQKIEVVQGPTYIRDIKSLPSADKEVQEVLEKEIIPALLANPKLPHLQGGGTPINHAGRL